MSRGPGRSRPRDRPSLRLLGSPQARRMIDDQRPLTAWVSKPDDALRVSASGGIEIAGPFRTPAS